MLLNDLMRQFNESVEQTGPRFTGYWKAKDPAPAGKKMVGSESINNEEANPTDKVTMDVPLFLRMMEYAKEDAKTDMDLHDVTERAIELMKQHDYLCMDNYSDLVGGEATGGEQPTNEANREFFAADQSPAMMKARAMAKEHGVKVQWVLQFIQNGTYIEGKKANNNVGARNRAVANLEKNWDKFSKLYRNFTPDTNAYMNATNEFKDTAQYGDDSGKNINHEIFQLLKNGATVYSNAAGRMGKVLRANNDGVVIASKRGKGFTSFNSGDPVKIKQDENEPNTYHIVNLMDEDWKDVAKVGAALGIAGGMGLAGKYADDTAQRVQIGNTQAYVITNPSVGIIPPNAKIVKGADGKMYKVWIKGGEPRTGSTKNMFATPIAEAKKKITAKNDPCRSGYHMVGTKKKNGREVPNCVPGKKGQ